MKTIDIGANITELAFDAKGKLERGENVEAVFIWAHRRLDQILHQASQAEKFNKTRNAKYAKKSTTR